jgi:hypothetical protein
MAKHTKKHSKINVGDLPAFPSDAEISHDGAYYFRPLGMTIRQYYVGQVIGAVVASNKRLVTAETLALHAHKIADALLKIEESK